MLLGFPGKQPGAVPPPPGGGSGALERLGQLGLGHAKSTWEASLEGPWSSGFKQNFPAKGRGGQKSRAGHFPERGAQKKAKKGTVGSRGVSSSCSHKLAQTGQLKTAGICCHSSGGSEVRNEDVSRVDCFYGFWRGSVPGLSSSFWWWPAVPDVAQLLDTVLPALPLSSLGVGLCLYISRF